MLFEIRTVTNSWCAIFTTAYSSCECVIIFIFLRVALHILGLLCTGALICIKVSRQGYKFLWFFQYRKSSFGDAQAWRWILSWQFSQHWLYRTFVSLVHLKFRETQWINMYLLFILSLDKLCYHSVMVSVYFFIFTI